MPTRKGPPYLRTPKLRGGVYVYTRRGRLTVASWPRKRGKPKSPATRYMNAWFKDATRKLRYVDARAMDAAIKLTKGTGLYPRDVLMKASSGGLFDIQFSDGTYSTFKQQGIYPVAFQGARLQLTANQAIIANTNQMIVWPLPVIDTIGLWNVSQPTRITIPPGINVIRLTGSCWNDNLAAVNTQLGIFDGAANIIQQTRVDASSRGAVVCETGPLPVLAGDSFTLRINYSANRSLVAGPRTSFSCEVLDADFPPIFQ